MSEAPHRAAIMTALVFFSSRRRHTRYWRDWSSDVCSSDLGDRSDRARRIMWGVGAVMQVCAFLAFLVLPFTTPVILANIFLFGVGAALAGEPFYKTWSQEVFPTMLRTTAQGLTFGIARLCLGVWSFFVPVLAETGIRPVALILTIFLA